MARPSKKPPKNRKIVGLAYGAVALASVSIPNSGISRMGNSEVAGIGIASVDHQIAIRPARPTVNQASPDNPPGGSVSRQVINSKGPKTSPIQAARTAPLL